VLTLCGRCPRGGVQVSLRFEADYSGLLRVDKVRVCMVRVCLYMYGARVWCARVREHDGAMASGLVGRHTEQHLDWSWGPSA
jgi:hypothetical protein